MAEDPRTDHGEVSTAVCRPQEEPHCQGGALSVQEHLSTGRHIVRSLLFANLCLALSCLVADGTATRIVSLFPITSCRLLIFL